MTRQEIIDEIMDNFDFVKVHNAMKALDWKWTTKNGMQIPDIPYMRKFVRELINNLFDESLSSISSGGFKIFKYGELIGISFEISYYYAGEDME